MEKEGLKSAFLILCGMTTHRDISGQLRGKDSYYFKRQIIETFKFFFI